MTLPDLLEELKVADPETYEEIVGWHQPRNQALDHLQGCIQRVCERRGWTLTLEYVMWYSPMRRWHAYISTGPRSCDTKDTASDSAAEALLAAYIAAVKGEKK